MRATGEQQLVEAAREGDGRAFARLVAPHRERLQAHCRQMLRSSHDAEDALQDTLVRAWRGLHRLDSGGSVGPWLHRIARNVSLDVIDRRRRSVPIDPSADADALAGSASPESRYELREALELAFAASTELLEPRQRAALILKDGLGFSAGDAAQALGTTRTSVYSALQRARKTIDEAEPEVSAPTRDASRFASAMEEGDVDAVVLMVRG